MRLRVSYQLFLLGFIVLAVYYNSLSAGFNSVDDSHIVAAYGMGAGKKFVDLFRPMGTYYYRPLIELSYYLDNRLWGMHPRFMHLENILLHLLNTILVFLVARQAADAWSVKESSFPLLSSLLFAVHPINTEPVAWIAGRTDPLACVFILSAIWCLQHCLIKDRIVYLLPSLAFFVLGLLTKEVAICFLFAALLLTICWPGTVRQRRKVLILLTCIILGSLMLLISLVIIRPSSSITAFFDGRDGGGLAALQTSIVALGFYLKKLVFPLPLNFAIDYVSPFYILPGIAIILLLPFCIRQQRFPAIMLVIGCVFLCPALLIAERHVAWTPFAERYLYLPSAFFCMGVVSVCPLIMEKLHCRQWGNPFLLFISCCATVISVQRTFVWHDNLTLYQDTVSKSPDYGATHLELGVALLQKGRIAEGRKEIEVAELLNKRPSLRNRIKESLMAVRLQECDNQGARDFFNKIYKKKEDADPEFLRLLNKADEGLLDNATVITVRNGLYCDMIENYKILYSKTQDPFNLYQAGILEFRCGNHFMARANIQKALLEAPLESHYRGAAVRWLEKLEAGQ